MIFIFSICNTEIVSKIEGIITKQRKKMKKLVLLLTIVCAGQLYGMEPEQKMGAFGKLPQELHKEVANALAKSKDLEQAIETD